jgi:hypothetical protein
MDLSDMLAAGQIKSVASISKRCDLIVALISGRLHEKLRAKTKSLMSPMKQSLSPPTPRKVMRHSTNLVPLSTA